MNTNLSYKFYTLELTLCQAYIVIMFKILNVIIFYHLSFFH